MINIDWAQLITKAMKEAALAAQQIAAVRADLAARNTVAASQISRIQDRIETLGDGVDAGEASVEDEEELAALTLTIKRWKAHKFSLGKVPAQQAWPSALTWPAAPAVPEISSEPVELGS
jgi:hypothetical protein